MYLETERLYLRSISESDIPALISLWTDQETTQFLGGPRDVTQLIESLREDIEHPENDVFNLWPLFIKKDNQFAGHCGLLIKEIRTAGDIELVYVIHKDCRRRGYAAEIGKALLDYSSAHHGRKQVYSIIDKGNTASKKTAERIGMNYLEDILRTGGQQKALYGILPE